MLLVSILLFIPVIIFTSCGKSQEQIKEEEILKTVDKQVFENVLGILNKSNQIAGIKIFKSVQYKRPDKNHIYFHVTLTPDGATANQNLLNNFVRNTCTGIAKSYSNANWVTVSAKSQGIAIAKAEYSPFTNQVKISR